MRSGFKIFLESCTLGSIRSFPQFFIKIYLALRGFKELIIRIIPRRCWNYISPLLFPYGTLTTLENNNRTLQLRFIISSTSENSQSRFIVQNREKYIILSLV